MTRGTKKSAPRDVRAGRVAIVGRPNVGKSTLLNALVGQKLAIVSPKPGTTRSVLLGVADHTSEDGERTQIAFLDTPGLEAPKSTLGRTLVEAAQGALEEVDAVLVLADASDAARAGALSPSDTRVLETAQKAGKPIVLALNKVDRVRDKRTLLPLLSKLGARDLAGVVPLSALRADGVERLFAALRTHLGTTLLYDDDTITDRSERFFCAELLREAILRNVQKEVPHGAAVRIDAFTEERGLVRIAATIVLTKESHKGIVIGARGAMLKTIGQEARLEMESFLERRVFLETFVRVEPGWTENANKVRALAMGDEG
ncbi:MAG: GTPase Era [Sandaracinus sp.]